MPSLKLRSLFRRDPDSPSLRERAAATASRVEAFKAAAPGPVPAPPSDLAQACDQAIVDWNAISPKSRAEEWGDEQLDEALSAYGAVFRRAITEPSRDAAELQAKARLLLHDLDAHNTTGREESTFTYDVRLTRVILREIAVLPGDATLPTSPDSDAKAAPGPVLSPTRQWAVKQADKVSLFGLDILRLNHLYDLFAGAADTWSAASCMHWAQGTPRSPWHTPNAGGDLAEREEQRAAEIRDRIVSEIRAKVPSNDLEHGWRLEILIRHELLCEGSLEHAPELRAEINKAWGG